jgi:integrase
MRRKLSIMARYLRGMGPLFRRGSRGESGAWWFKLDGRRIRTPHTIKANAELWRRQYLADEGHSRIELGAESATVADILDLVEQDYKQSGKASSASLASRIKRLRGVLGPVRLVDLRDRHFSLYTKDRLAEVRKTKAGSRPTRPSTVNRELEILRRALKLAAGQTPPLIQAVPRIIMLDESDNVRTQTIDHATYKRLCEALPNAERWLCVLAYHIGWRLGKLLELTWSQVDWDRMVILAPSRQREGKQVGTAPIYGDMQTALREAMRGNADTVIHRPDGSPVVDIRKAWRRATKAAGCPGLRFHDLRACAASTLIDAGVPQIDAMAILGHRTDAMFRRYRIVSAKRLQSIGRQMEAHLENQKDGKRQEPGQDRGGVQ